MTKQKELFQEDVSNGVSQSDIVQMLEDYKTEQLTIPVVSVTFVCPNGCNKGYAEPSNGYKECKECAYIEQTN